MNKSYFSGTHADPWIASVAAHKPIVLQCKETSLPNMVSKVNIYTGEFLFCIFVQQKPSPLIII